MENQENKEEKRVTKKPKHKKEEKQQKAAQWEKQPNPALHFPADHQQGEKWSDAYYKFCKDEKKEEIPQEEINTDVSWKEVEWDTAREQLAKQLLENETKLVSSEDRNRFETEAASFWEKFYQHNKNKFFKERNYLHYQFPILKLDENKESKLKGKVLMEAGCGTGSTLFPLVETHKETKFIAFDFSSSAVELVKKNALFDERCMAFVCDLSEDPLPDSIPPNSVDYVTLIFVLSALSPEKMVSALKKLNHVIKPGSHLV